ncbi:MAG TPA: hypothetical protein VGC97_11430, partial [Pyrinomonadaceae bacterium]
NIEAQNIFTALKNSVKETQKTLFPLPIEDVRFYLLRVEEIPASYKITDTVDDREFYLHLWAFKNKEKLNLNCDKEDKLCESIYSTIPHELTHGAIEDLVDDKNLSWFKEGLGNYVGKEVSRKYRPLAVEESFKQNIPEISLHRDDIRESLFLWEHLSSAERTNDSMRNEWFRYIAAEQLIRLIIKNAKNEGIEKPLDLLLTKLKEQKDKPGKPAGAEEILSLIQESLKVAPGKLGSLDGQTQKNLVDEALNLLLQNETDTEKKKYALYVLAGIDDVQISEYWIKYLLDAIYRQKNNSEYQRELAATALARRFKQNGFDEILNGYLKLSKEMSGKSLKKLKKELQELSIRPPVQ